MYRPISSDHTLPQTRKKVKREFATSSPPTKNATVSVAYTAAEKPVLFARTKANAIAPRPAADAIADARLFSLAERSFTTHAGGLFLLLPLLVRMDPEGLVARCGFPG